MDERIPPIASCSPLVCSYAIARKPNGEHVLCGSKPDFHIIWDARPRHTVVCKLHAQRAAALYEPLQIHERAPDCAMPGAFWYPEEHTCKVPPEDDPLHAVERELDVVGASYGWAHREASAHRDASAHHDGRVLP